LVIANIVVEPAKIVDVSQRMMVAQFDCHPELAFFAP
jgi:hypothetical protein